MIKNYLTIALRHLLREPQYAALNIIGLTIGLTSSLLILLYLNQELSFDTHHQNIEQIYRIGSDIKESGNSFRWAYSQISLGPTLKAEFPEVEQYVRYIPIGEVRLEYDNKNYLEERVYYVDSTNFEIFSFTFLMGNPESALNAPNSIVLSKTIADRIFKGENPMGKIIEWDVGSLKVTGVYEDVPLTSHIIPMAMVSSSTEPRTRTVNWGAFSFYNYVKLKEGTNPEEFEKKLAIIIEKYNAPIFDQFNIKIKYELIAVKDIHLYSDFELEPEPLGDINYIYIFAAVGIFMLLIACINYMNLATARSTNRAVEVGVRKVMGAYRKWLIGQFLTESMLLSLMSLVASFLLLMILVPIVNATLQLSLEFINLFHPVILLTILGVILFTGILGGSYPAFYLSSFNPVIVLKGNKLGRSGGKAFRRVLVTTQFAISMFMFIGTAVIYNQMQYVRNQDLGFDKEQILNLTLQNTQTREKWPVLKDKLQANPDIAMISTTSLAPGSPYGKSVLLIENEDGQMDERGVNNYAVDYDFFPTLSIPIVEGRNFSRKYAMDTANAVLVNEAMVRRMNWTNPIGKKVYLAPMDTVPPSKVIGVVKDFHQRSFYNPIEALLFRPRLNNVQVLIKIQGNVKNTVKAVEGIWNNVVPGIPFEYTFLDEEFMVEYEKDQLRGRLFLGFTSMTILIACLGLLGLAAYTSEQRSKEISIRKVLGASSMGLIAMLVKDFVLLVAIAALPAFGLAWYFMNEWLKNFQYHKEINLFVFAMVLFATLAITVITTGYHAWRAATANPAENLKYE